MTRYRITGGPTGDSGLDYKAKRAEVGDIVEDLPRDSIKWLREQGYIELVGKETPTSKSEETTEEVAD